MSILSKIFSGIPLGMPLGTSGFNFNPKSPSFSIYGFNFSPRKQTLPDGTQIDTVTTKQTPPGGEVPPPVENPAPVDTGKKTTTSAPKSTVPSQYINPATGMFYTPQEYAMKMSGETGNVGNGDIPQYAGDTLTEGPQTTADLERKASDLNNTRNDIATGATDPYGIASKSGVAYSPQEMAAIEKAYAGIYDPAINSALSKLEKKMKQDEEEAALKQWKEQQVFSTNENIRQYNATTGSKAKGIADLGLKRGADGYVDPYEYMQKAYAAPNMDQFISDYPPEQYLNPNATKLTNADGSPLIPAYLSPKTADQSLQDKKDEVWKQLSRPEVQALSDDEKALIIQNEYGLDPKIFGLYPVTGL